VAPLKSEGAADLNFPGAGGACAESAVGADSSGAADSNSSEAAVEFRFKHRELLTQSSTVEMETLKKVNSEIRGTMLENIITNL
jgi:hypothetical protein